MNDEVVHEHVMSDGTVARYGRSSFNHPLFPNRPLYFVQMRSGSAWIVDKEVATPDAIDFLGPDKGRIPFMRNGELLQTSPTWHTGWWSQVAWQRINFEGYTSDDYEVYDNSPFWVNAFDHYHDKEWKPPVYRDVKAHIIKMRQAVYEMENHWTNRLYRWFKSL